MAFRFPWLVSWGDGNLEQLYLGPNTSFPGTNYFRSVSDATVPSHCNPSANEAALLRFAQVQNRHRAGRCSGRHSSRQALRQTGWLAGWPH